MPQMNNQKTYRYNTYNAAEHAANRSTYEITKNWKGDPIITILDAAIWQGNLNGDPDEYTRPGQRLLNVCLSEPMAQEMKAAGFNVKRREGRNPEDLPMYFVKVDVTLEYERIPVITLKSSYTVRGKNAENMENTLIVTNENIDSLHLDNNRYKRIDIRFHAYDKSGNKEPNAISGSWYTCKINNPNDEIVLYMEPQLAPLSSYADVGPSEDDDMPF